MVKTIGIIANTGKPGWKQVARSLSKHLAACGISPILEETSARELGKGNGVPLAELPNRAEILVTLGGDGTILGVVRELTACGGWNGKSFPRIAGINLGNLGFLTFAKKSDKLEAVAKALAEGDYRESYRAVLAVNVEQENTACLTRYALNEVVVGRGNVSRLVRLTASIGPRETVTEYVADGIMVATPTGSTAYSLAAGGPLIEPEAEVVVITPICPHSLGCRPAVIGIDKTVRIAFRDVETNWDRSDDAMTMTVDGQKIPNVNLRADIVVTEARFRVPLIFAKDSTFFGVVKEKLHWSGSASSEGAK